MLKMKIMLIIVTVQWMLRKKCRKKTKLNLKHNWLRVVIDFISSCCSQAFILLIAALFVGKIQGADYSSIWIISPLLFLVSIILFCLGCTIFCITEVADEDILHEHSSKIFGIPVGTDYDPPEVPSNPNDTVENKFPKSTWDPEKGQVWDNSLSPSKTSSTQNEDFVESNPNQSLAKETNEASLNTTPKEKNTIDLMDNNNITNAQEIQPIEGELHELD